MTVANVPLQNLKYIKADNRFNVYSNHTSVSSTNYDVKLTLSQIDSVTPSETIVIEHGNVTLSPQHAKALLKNLAIVIERYEAAFGEIDLDRLMKTATGFAKVEGAV